jgi:hypothetical protein
MNLSSDPATESPFESMELHADLMMLKLKPYATWSDEGLLQIVGLMKQMQGDQPFNVLLKASNEMDGPLENWKDRLLSGPYGSRIRAVIVVTDSAVFGVRTQIYLGKQRSTLRTLHLEQVSTYL